MIGADEISWSVLVGKVSTEPFPLFSPWIRVVEPLIHFSTPPRRLLLLMRGKQWWFVCKPIPLVIKCIEYPQHWMTVGLRKSIGKAVLCTWTVAADAAAAAAGSVHQQQQQQPGGRRVAGSCSSATGFHDHCLTIVSKFLSPRINCSG